MKKIEGLKKEGIEARARAFELPRLGVDHELFFARASRPLQLY